MVNKLNAIEEYYHIFMSFPVGIRLGLFAFSIFTLTLLIAIFNMFIFNFIIIPRIEKRIGKKINLQINWSKYILLGNFMYQHIEVMKYIIQKYKITKAIKNKSYNEKTDLALEIRAEQYVITPFEIFMSFAVKINFIISLAFAFLSLIIFKIYHIQ